MASAERRSPPSGGLPGARAGSRGGDSLDERLLRDAGVASAIATHGAVTRRARLATSDRAVGARLAGAIAAEYGDDGFRGEVRLELTGSAGQSLGAFLLDGLVIDVRGEANDYVGKGMAGGEIVLRPPEPRLGGPGNVIAGNTCLYGATGGRLYAAGRAGERFAVRNSAAHAVVEGTGDHCCEYMTGGVVVVLGPVGRNACAGMTGGTAYFLADECAGWLSGHQTVADAGMDEGACSELTELLRTHSQRTRSAVAAGLLAMPDGLTGRFIRVCGRAPGAPAAMLRTDGSPASVARA